MNIDMTNEKRRMSQNGNDYGATCDKSEAPDGYYAVPVWNLINTNTGTVDHNVCFDCDHHPECLKLHAEQQTIIDTAGKRGGTDEIDAAISEEPTKGRLFQPSPCNRRFRKDDCSVFFKGLPA